MQMTRSVIRIGKQIPLNYLIFFPLFKYVEHVLCAQANLCVYVLHHIKQILIDNRNNKYNSGVLNSYAFRSQAKPTNE